MTTVREYMVSPVRSVRETDSVRSADEVLSTLGISALPVVDSRGTMVGVLSRTDLLRIGRMRATRGRGRKVLALPDSIVRGVMTTTVEVVDPDAALAEAARRMTRLHVHRLYAAEDGRPIGVVSTKEMMRAVVDAELEDPLAEVMHASIVAVDASAPLSLAIDRMALAHHGAVVVLEAGWPVGIFTQRDALAAREAPAADRVDYWMDPRLICLPMAMPVFRAAEQAVATRARCVLPVDGEGPRGIVTGTDFARLIKG